MIESLTITGDTVKSAIAKAISNDAISTGCKLYKEQAKQGFAKPSFFIWQIKTTHDKKLNRRAERSYQMVVRYFPKDNENSSYSALTQKGEELTAVLEYIDLGNGQKASASDMYFEIEDNVLHFFITYNFNVRKAQQAQAPMDAVSATTNIKQG